MISTPQTPLQACSLHVGIPNIAFLVFFFTLFLGNLSRSTILVICYDSHIFTSNPSPPPELHLSLSGNMSQDQTHFLSSNL